MKPLLLIIGFLLMLWGMLHDRLFPPPPGPIDRQITRIVIDKSARQLTAYANGDALARYPIALGFTPEGDKTREGDGKTPEGIFTINRRNPQSSYHLSLGIDYPQPDDIARARAQGVSPGGDIFIHGQPNRIADNMMIPGDWTAGCVALTNPQMRELWDHAPIGTIVEIRP